ncbi:MAG: ABC transporter substrate-binding protein [Sandaracinaceae bacterium]|nr:ABC transporter substrate-binding protein [Sandaracinaceae bacterium]
MSGTGGGRAYEPVADIAKGGMGRVELVVRREGSFARVYAMKRLRPELSEDAEVRAMFLEEARIAGLIRHPNVVPVLDVGEDEQGAYFVMDFVEGVAAYRPLVMAVESGQRLPVAFCVEVMRQTAHGLAAAHELVGAGGRPLSVVHRDVSPQNILLGFDGLVRVTDFGVARILDHQPHDAAAITGKIGYMSPEQIGGRPLDARSDLFSFGVVLYEMLACGRLYGGPRAEAFRRICLEEIPDIGAVRGDVPPELAELVGKLLAKTPEARPQSAAVVAEWLESTSTKLREAGQEAALRATLLETFAGEHRRQQELVAAALERTRVEIPLVDPSADLTGDEVTATTRSGPVTAELDDEPTELPPRAPPRRVATAPGGAPAAVRPRAWWLAVVVALGLGGLGYAALAWSRVEAPRSPAPGAPPLGPGECVSSEACRAREGAGSLCDVATGRCRSVLSARCPALFPTSAGADPDAIAIGTIFDRSSPNQRARERAAELAVDGVNRGGGIDGHPILLMHCDASAGATEAAGELVRAGVAAIIGPSTSSDTEAAFAAHRDDGVLFISPSATATQLEAIDTSEPGLLWRTAPPDSLQSAVILSRILDQPEGAASLAVVRRSNDVYAQSLSVILQESAIEAGLRVDASPVFADRAAIERVASAALATTPDAVVFLSSHIDDAAAFLDAASALDGYDGTRLYFPDAAANDDLFALATRGAGRFGAVRATRPAAPSTIITSEFVSDYMAANGGEDPLQFSFTAQTYDATLLVMLGAAYAVGGSGELTAPRIARGITLLSSGATEHRLLSANVHSIIAALRSEHPDVDVVGASGPLDYDPATEELTRATYEVLEVRGDPPRFEVAQRAEVPTP